MLVACLYKLYCGNFLSSFQKKYNKTMMLSSAAGGFQRQHCDIEKYQLWRLSGEYVITSGVALYLPTQTILRELAQSMAHTLCKCVLSFLRQRKAASGE